MNMWRGMVKGLRYLVLGGLIGFYSVTFMGCIDSGGSSKKLGDGHDFGPNDKGLVVAMGDSITAGSEAPGVAPYPSRLAGMIRKAVQNRGVPGAQASQGAGSVGGVLSGVKPGFITILYGANDAIHQRDADATAANLRSMVQAAKANQTIPVLATVMPMSGGRAIFNGGVNRINERIRNIAKEEKVKLVDLHKAVSRDPDAYLFDGLHPNDTGTQLIALEFADAFN